VLAFSTTPAQLPLPTFPWYPSLLPHLFMASLQVVIAFRGTASMANLRADLQVWRRRWPEGIGTPLLCR
jgi:hypothetical protein